jgi:hypothetical protein
VSSTGGRAKSCIRNVEREDPLDTHIRCLMFIKLGSLPVEQSCLDAEQVRLRQRLVNVQYRIFFERRRYEDRRDSILIF